MAGESVDSDGLLWRSGLSRAATVFLFLFVVSTVARGALCVPRTWLFVVVQLLRSWWLVRWPVLVLALILPLASRRGVPISIDLIAVVVPANLVPVGLRYLPSQLLLSFRRVKLLGVCFRVCFSISPSLVSSGLLPSRRIGTGQHNTRFEVVISHIRCSPQSVHEHSFHDTRTTTA